MRSHGEDRAATTRILLSSPYSPECVEEEFSETGDGGQRYLGDTPEANFLQAQYIAWLAPPEEYRDPATESALA